MRRSASGAGLSPAASSFARMKRSIGLRTQLAFFTAARRPHRRNQRPVRLILGPGGDPARETFLLRPRSAFSSSIGGGIASSESLERMRRQLAFVRLAGHDGAGFDRLLAAIEPQVGLAGGAVRPVAGEAVLAPGSAGCRGCISRSPTVVPAKQTTVDANVAVTKRVNCCTSVPCAAPY